MGVDGNRREGAGREGNDGVTMMDACVTGSIFILKANFIGRASGKGGDGRKSSKERVCKGACVRGRNCGQKRRPTLGQRILHGSSVWAKT